MPLGQYHAAASRVARVTTPATYPLVWLGTHNNPPGWCEAPAPICPSMVPYPSKEGMAPGDKVPLTSHLS